MKSAAATVCLLLALTTSMQACSNKTENGNSSSANTENANTSPRNLQQVLEENQQKLAQIKKDYLESCVQTNNASKFDANTINQFCTCKYDQIFGSMKNVETIELDKRISMEGKVPDELLPIIQQSEEKCAEQIKISNSNTLAPQSTTTSSAQESQYSYLTGMRPEEVVMTSSLAPQFRVLLKKDYNEFANRLSVSDVVSRQGDWYVGEGIANHGGGNDEAFFAVHALTGGVYAAILANGKDLIFYGAQRPKELPDIVKNWLVRRGGAID